MTLVREWYWILCRLHWCTMRKDCLLWICQECLYCQVLRNYSWLNSRYNLKKKSRINAVPLEFKSSKTKQIYSFRKKSKSFSFFQFYSQSKCYNGNTACLGNSNKNKGIQLFSLHFFSLFLIWCLKSFYSNLWADHSNTVVCNLFNNIANYLFENLPIPTIFENLW